MPPKKRGSTTPANKETNSSTKKTSPDKKENSIVCIENHKEKDTDFVILCKELLVPNLLCNHAWSVWSSVSQVLGKDSDMNRKLWGACLFIAVTEFDMPCFTLTDLLKAVGMNVKQFLNVVRKMDVNVDTISPKVNTALTRLEKKYDVSLALYQRFVKTCSNIYTESNDEEVKRILQSSWTMFLLAKGNVLQMGDDLVIAFQLLLCVLEFFTKRCVSSLLQPQYKSSVSATTQSPPVRTSRRNHGKAKPRPPEMDMQLIEVLCKENDCSVDEVKNVYQTSFSAFLDHMGLSGSQELPDVEDISKQYEELYLKNKDFDARLFLVSDKTLTPNKVDLTNVEMTPKKNQSGQEHILIPPHTPIRAAMNSIQQLRFDLNSAQDQPSDVLCGYFKNCTVDPSEEIAKRVDQLGQVFSCRFAQAVGQGCVGLGKQRFCLGVRLYYRVMEAMLKSEEKRLSDKNFSKLLNSSAFHTSLLACALEVIMATYVGSTFKNGDFGSSAFDGTSVETDLCFPWILDVFQLPAFDFYKVIESFIKAEPSLSRDMIKHLERCEHLIMEHLAWRGDSPMFELLQQSHEEGPVEQAEPPATLNQPLKHNHTAADLYLSPVRPTRQTPATACDSPVVTQPQAQMPKPFKSNSLSLFYKKLYRMAYIRLNKLFSALLSDRPELEPVIWTLLEHTMQNEYELLRDRHLDQLMMSAMYAICKVKNVDLRFKTIVTAYKDLPNTSQETFKRVLIREGQYDSIIVFYNLVFIQKLKTIILQYSSPRPPPLSPIPHIPCSPGYKYPNSPLRLPVSNNVYISPLKSNRMSPGVMTPRSRFLVSIGESFGTGDKFLKINQMMSSSDWSLKRSSEGGSGPKPLKRLRFDTDGQDEADGSKPSSESTLIQKLTEMRSARSRMQEQKMKEESKTEDTEP
ncbi:retinoblastoma-associated protein [Chanos chanos]|uniref:Retinoblastoma-associated protein n=1 Tax=Chanos chanos TaxID=29144 RepID=A0A6J2VZS8_CHACN|nr:retinoblastoma-associated protein [Chanos chanos]